MDDVEPVGNYLLASTTGVSRPRVWPCRVFLPTIPALTQGPTGDTLGCRRRRPWSVRSNQGDERAYRQAGQHEPLERAHRASRPAAEAPQDRRPGGATLRAAAR